MDVFKITEMFNLHEWWSISYFPLNYFNGGYKKLVDWLVRILYFQYSMKLSIDFRLRFASEWYMIRVIWSLKGPGPMRDSLILSMGTRMRSSKVQNFQKYWIVLSRRKKWVTKLHQFFWSKLNIPEFKPRKNKIDRL